MKTLYNKGMCVLVALTFYLMPSTTNAQCNSLITLSTQADVDAFPSRYGCSVLTNSLIILGYPTGDITNLDSLYVIERIDESLRIAANVWLTSLDGLRNLKSVGGSVSVEDNSRLFNINGLSGLETCGRLTLSGGELTDITGLRSLKKCLDFTVTDQRRLSSLDGLQDLTSMYSLVLQDNPHLSNLSALHGPRSITWIINIARNPELSSLAGLDNVELTSTSVIAIMDNGVTSLDGLNSYDTLNEVLVIGNRQLTNISALGSLEKVGRLQIEQNNMLTDLGNFPVLQSVVDLIVESNVSLTNVKGFSALTSARNITVSGSPLTSLHGLHNVTNIQASLWLGHDPGLVDLSGLESLASVGHLNIFFDDHLTSFKGLSALRSVNGSFEPGHFALTMYQNPLLADVSALSQVTSLGGDLRIESCNSLKDLHGLEGITSVDGVILVRRNESLETLSALANVASIGIGTYAFFDTIAPSSFYIAENNVLKDLGIRGLHSMPGSLRVISNPMLENVNDLAAIEQVGLNENDKVDVTISQNNKLLNVDSLSSLTSIVGSTRQLTIEGNEELTEFCGLYSVISESGDGLAISLANNGKETTPEEIIANGPCSGELAAQPGELTFTNITDATMTVTFTPDSPAPTGNYLLLMRAHESSYPEDLPMDGNEYSVGQVIGSSTIVVGKGNGSGFNIVYLSPATTYHFALFSFDSGLNYDTTDPVLGSQATLEQQTDPNTQPTNLVFSDVTNNSMTVSFTASTNNNVDGYITVMRPYSSPYPEDIPADGTGYQVGNVIGSSSIVVGMGQATTLNVVYLNPDTEYWFDVYSFTHDGEYDYLTTSPLEAMQQTAPTFAASAYPNPFAESVTIRFSVKEDNSRVRVTIFDKMGLPVAELLNAEVSRGTHEVQWTGVDSRGNKTASGLYHYVVASTDDPVRGTLVAK